MNTNALYNSLIASLRQVFSGRLLTDAQEMSPFLKDWRKRYQGTALAVVEPESTADVANIIRVCINHQINITPQGGNTSLSGGSVPNIKGNNLVMRLNRLNHIRHIDTQNNTITVEAGCILQTIQMAAIKSNRLFPLSLASQGTCTIGGNLATNAGGVQVLRYGNARDLCLGLEVVTATGEIWNGLRGLRKDNSGYDLKQLFIGSEGTLGIITAAVLKLFPLPMNKQVAWVAVPSISHAIQLLTLAQYYAHNALTAFELISNEAFALVLKHFKTYHSPLTVKTAWYILLEISDDPIKDNQNNHNNDNNFLHNTLHALLNTALKTHIIIDAALSINEQQFKHLWALRENISEAQRLEGANIKHDIALPISDIPAFMAMAEQQLRLSFPNVRLIIFGHLGDGNLHYNVYYDMHDFTQYLLHQSTVNRIVHDCVNIFNGSISAEHGLGILRRDEAARYKSSIELNLMHRVKHALDPYHIMNPNKVLTEY